MVWIVSVLIMWLVIYTTQTQTLSCVPVWLFASLWTVARQTPLSMRFFRQEYWRQLPFSSPGDLPDLGIELVSPVFRRRQRHPTPVLLPRKSHGQRSLAGCSPWGRKESGRTERLHFHFSLSCIGEGNGNPLQCSCLENPRDGGA